jgi:hypothetical protein
MTSPLGTPRGRCDEYSSSFSLSLETKVYRSSASSNPEPAHTQTNTLLPTYDEVVNLTGLLETKVMSVSSGKQ